jgi:lipopolysaccharide export system protein LptA
MLARNAHAVITLRLPDGSSKSFPGPVTVAEIASSIGAGLARAALAGKVNGKLVDTSYRVESDAEVTIITPKSPEGVDILRHSTSHLMAQAVQELFPGAQVTIGPVIENGFYYDFSYKRPFTPEDLIAIEKKMADIARQDLPVQRKVMARDEAVNYFQSIGEKYKAELIAAIPANEQISLYGQGNWIDLCRGPHVPSTGKLKVFKLMRVAGAYWRGDSKNEMLQRIYGTAWATKEDQDAYLKMLEEAEKRDHRTLGTQLDLFHMQPEAPALVETLATGHTLLYEDAKRLATYTTGPTAKAHIVGTQGDVTADVIELFLKPGANELERAEADGSVIVKEGPRIGTGAHLTYTPGNETYVMTGAPVEIEERTPTGCNITVGSKVTFNRSDVNMKIINNGVTPVTVKQCAPQ